MLTNTCVTCTGFSSFSTLFFHGVLAGDVLDFIAAAAAGKGKSGVKAQGRIFEGILGKVVLGRVLSINW